MMAPRQAEDDTASGKALKIRRECGPLCHPEWRRPPRHSFDTTSFNDNDATVAASMIAATAVRPIT
jgi:hypothetical protein